MSIIAGSWRRADQNSGVNSRKLKGWFCFKIQGRFWGVKPWICVVKTAQKKSLQLYYDIQEKKNKQVLTNELFASMEKKPKHGLK